MARLKHHTVQQVHFQRFFGKTACANLLPGGANPPTTTCTWEKTQLGDGRIHADADQKTCDLFNRQQELQRKVEQLRGKLDEQTAKRRKLQIADAEEAAGKAAADLQAAAARAANHAAGQQPVE